MPPLTVKRIVPVSEKHNKLGGFKPALNTNEGSEILYNGEFSKQSFASLTIIEYEPALRLSK